MTLAWKRRRAAAEAAAKKRKPKRPKEEAVVDVTTSDVVTSDENTSVEADAPTVAESDVKADAGEAVAVGTEIESSGDSTELDDPVSLAGSVEAVEVVDAPVDQAPVDDAPVVDGDDPATDTVAP